jgi:hypothetical protein
MIVAVRITVADHRRQVALSRGQLSLLGNHAGQRRVEKPLRRCLP